MSASTGIICRCTLFRVWRSYRAGYFRSGRVTYAKWKVDIFFHRVFCPAIRADAYNFWLRDAAKRVRDRSSLARSLYDRTNVTVHKSMVTWLNTAWIYRTRLSPSVMINYDDRMTVGRSPTRGWRHARVCTGWRVIWGALWESFSGGIERGRERVSTATNMRGLLYARRLLASRQYGLSV